MLSDIILNAFPRIRHKFTKYTYFYLGCLFLLIQYYLFIHNYNWLIFFIALSIIGFLLYKENSYLTGTQDIDFKELEEKMNILIPASVSITNYLYVDPNLLGFIYSIRAFKLTDKNNFDEMIIRINRFLQIYENIIDNNKANNKQIESLSILKKEALNYFHSIIYKLVSDREMTRHNELRYILEEKITDLFNECLEHRKGQICFNEFGYDPFANSHFDIY